MMRIICAVFLIGLCNGLVQKTKSVVDIEAISDQVLGISDEFRFKCNATVNYTMSLIIDNASSGVKYERVSNTTESKENIINFTFSNTMASDNGTTFQCAAGNSNDTVQFSDILTLQIEYPPHFAEGSNVTILEELPVDKTSSLPCTVLMSNPPLTGIVFTNTSDNHANVQAKVTNMTGLITFTKAKVNNKGEYTCTAINEVGNTTLTYNTYIGGVPDVVVDVLSFGTDNGSLLIGLGVNDNSDAPALSLVISLHGVIEEKVFNFLKEKYSIPVKNQIIQVVDISVEFLEAGNYTLEIVACNEIGNVTVIKESRYIAGLNIDVEIETPSLNVIRGNNFTFTCKAPKPVNFSVLIDAHNSSTKTSRIVKGKNTTNTQEFIFTDTNYLDNGTILQCVANGVYKSEMKYMIVFYPPMYLNSSEGLTGVNGTKNITININNFTANPEPNKFTWMKDGVEIKSNKRIKIINATSLNFNPLLQEDIGNYTVTAENDIGQGNGSASIDVLWTPYNLQPVVNPTLKAGNTTYQVNLNISSHPDVSFATWLRNGVDIINDDHISPGLESMTFMSLMPKDNGTYSVIVYNSVGNTTIPFNMMVLYPPTVNVDNAKLGVFEYSYEVINITVDANPTNYTTKWMKNGTELKPTDDIVPAKDSLTFHNITNDEDGNYTVNVANVLGSQTIEFEIAVYDGPFFMEGEANGTVLSEVQDGTSHNITCTVKSAKPAVTGLTIEPATGFNWKTVTDGVHSVTLVIDKATAVNNTRKFTCVAVNNVTTSKLVFNNFVGGVPNKLAVVVIKTIKDDTVMLSLNVTDMSDAPATGVLINLKDVNAKNLTFMLPDPPLNGSNHVFDSAIKETFTQLGAGVHYLSIYGVNMIGITRLTDYNFTVTLPKKSHTVAIAVGVAVPLAVLLLIALVAGGGFYYWKSKRTGEYSPLSVQEGDGSKYGTST